MTRPPTISLTELAEVITAAFEEYPNEDPADRRGCRLFRSVLTVRLKERYGDDWVRAWNYIAARQSRVSR